VAGATGNTAIRGNVAIGSTSIAGARTLTLASNDESVSSTMQGGAEKFVTSTFSDGTNTFKTQQLAKVLTISAGQAGGAIELNPGGGVSEVQMVKISGSAALGGTFAVTFGGQTASSISPTITAAALKVKLDALSSIGDVAVSRSAVKAYGYEWTITFDGSTNVGDVAAFTCASSLTGAGAACAVSTMVAGASPGAGTFKVGSQADFTVAAVSGDVSVKGATTLKGALTLQAGFSMDTGNAYGNSGQTIDKSTGVVTSAATSLVAVSSGGGGTLTTETLTVDNSRVAASSLIFAQVVSQCNAKAAVRVVSTTATSGRLTIVVANFGTEACNSGGTQGKYKVAFMVVGTA